MLTAIESWGPSAAIRACALLYPAANALHILGIAHLVGSGVAMDARGPGLGEDWRGPLANLEPVAVSDLLPAAGTGLLLFAVRASAYIENPALLIKWALIVIGLANVFALCLLLKSKGNGAPSSLLGLPAVLYAMFRFAALHAGRRIAFTIEV